MPLVLDPSPDSNSAMDSNFDFTSVSWILVRVVPLVLYTSPDSPSVLHSNPDSSSNPVLDSSSNVSSLGY
ncbi:hypothetical protein TNIN_437591 [Trichonephila inaurata madagascariensis]|uniref:Uncharacterized protein n=1 Tax=Trichonephila inaurata madagascariensis TaxID=2747483 RepID=A0A8X6YA85_9ARAC|nr:hypothetical protein TNIN_437591 [Trichonephila inaurata madagascariensis]